MKRFMFALIVALVLTATYFIGSPYIAVYNIENSIKDNDPDKLSDNVDFQLLRQNFKDQLNFHFMKSAGETLKDHPFSAFGTAIASKFSEGLVDSLITPYGILHFLQGNSIELASSSQNPSENKNIQSKQLFYEASYKLQGFNKFTISIPMKNTQPVKNIVFCLKRYGFNWKVTNIEFPFEELLANTDLKDPHIETGPNEKNDKISRDIKGNLKITTTDIDSQFVENGPAGRLFVITGKARNGYGEARSLIRINGKLYTKGKKLSNSEIVYCGNVIAIAELSKLGLDEIKSRLGNAKGDNNANMNIKPGEDRPFMIVFLNLPENLEEFTLEVAGSEQAVYAQQ
ncbi:MAG: DUF3426 domain-containing protein [Candidatus Cloacimonetes bacterium]|nr:DUF3426 domain-containing protein [Candidatus Cloacimonadota bacterium]MDY0230771.1 DUF3426 domain-containing protein [Candidatus Cloacimonadaceae bacterium]